MSSEANLYEILGVSPTSEPVVIEGAYRALMRRYQPEVAKNADVAAKVQRINAAYSTLSNPRKRAIYDAGLRSREAPPATNTSKPAASSSPNPQMGSEPPRVGKLDEFAGTSDWQRNRGIRHLVPVGIGILVLIWLFNSLGSDPGTSDNAVENDRSTNSSAAIQPNVQSNSVANAPAPPLVLDDAIAFADPANCVAAPALDRVFDAMLPISDQTGLPLSASNVALGDVHMRPKVEDVVHADDPVGTIAKLSSVRLPRESVWHDLRVSRLIVSYYAPPETDSSYSRSITFRASPDEVRSALAKSGFNPPSSGNYSTLTDGACGGSMQVLPVTGGTELRCSWGC